MSECCLGARVGREQRNIPDYPFAHLSHLSGGLWWGWYLEESQNERSGKEPLLSHISSSEMSKHEKCVHLRIVEIQEV